MKIWNFILVLALGIGCLSNTYAALPALDTSQAQSLANSNSNSTQNSSNDPASLPSLNNNNNNNDSQLFGVKPQTADNQNEADILKNKPSYVKDEWVQKYGVPKDGDWYGCESEGRYRLRQFVSGNGMRAMDWAAEYIRSHPNYGDMSQSNWSAWCGDHAGMIFPYLLTGVDPTLYIGGNSSGMGRWSGDGALRDYGYDTVRGGTLLPGDIFTGGIHAAMWWQTANDAMGKTSTPNGAGISQWADTSYANNFAYTQNGSEAIYRLNRSPVVENITNVNGNQGNINFTKMPQYWKDLKKQYYPEPTVYNNMRTTKKL